MGILIEKNAFEKELADFDDDRHITVTTACLIQDKFYKCTPFEVDGKSYFVRSFENRVPDLGKVTIVYKLEEIK